MKVLKSFLFSLSLLLLFSCSGGGDLNNSSGGTSQEPVVENKPVLSGSISVAADANNVQAPTLDFTNLVNDDAEDLDISTIEIAITTESVTTDGDLSDETIGNVMTWTDVTANLNGGDSANNHDPANWSLYQPSEATLSLNFDGLGDSSVNDLIANTDYYVSVRITKSTGEVSDVSTAPNSSTTSAAWNFQPLFNGLTLVDSKTAATSFGTWATDVDSLDHILAFTMTTPSTMPGTRQVLLESGGSGVGQSVMMSAAGNIEFHSGSATAEGSPRVTSTTSLQPNTQYTIIIFVDNVGGDIYLWVSELGNISQINLDFEASDTAYNQTDHCGTDGGVYGLGTSGSNGGISSGTFSVFGATYDSDLFIYNGRPVGF